MSMTLPESSLFHVKLEPPTSRSTVPTEICTLPVVRSLLFPDSTVSPTMSLFGSSPDDSSVPSHSKPQSKSLFEDEATPGATSNASLFADEDDGGGPSPWALPTPKKAGRSNLVKTLLPASAVPESYVDMFDTVLESGDRLGPGISLTGVKKILEDSGLDPAEQARVLALVIPGGKEGAEGLGRSEFNVLLALIGLSQENEEATLDGVDERRKSAYIYIVVGCFKYDRQADIHERPSTTIVALHRADQDSEGFRKPGSDNGGTT